MHVLQEPDPWTDEILRLVHDYDAATIAGWPEAYTAGTVDAVRYVQRESVAALRRRQES